MPRKRFYTEDEFGAVLKRAAEIQRTEGPDDRPGLSLAELEQIAEEAGIGSEFVKRAAFELEEGRLEESGRLLGGPTRIQREWIVDGEMNETKWESVLGALRHTFGTEGREILEGRTREWIHRDQMGGRVRVSASPAGGQTRVRISYGMTEWLWLHVIFLSLGIGAVAVEYALLNVGVLLESGIALLTLMVFYLIGWVSFRIFTRWQARRLQKLLARLDRIIADLDTGEARVNHVGAGNAAAGRLDGSLLSSDAPVEDAALLQQRGKERN